MFSEKKLSPQVTFSHLECSEKSAFKSPREKHNGFREPCFRRRIIIRLTVTVTIENRKTFFLLARDMHCPFVPTMTIWEDLVERFFSIARKFKFKPKEKVFKFTVCLVCCWRFYF